MVEYLCEKDGLVAIREDASDDAPSECPRCGGRLWRSDTGRALDVEPVGHET
jgi:hypothetical protein